MVAGEAEELEIFRLKGLVCLPPRTSPVAAEGEREGEREREGEGEGEGGAEGGGGGGGAEGAGRRPPSSSSSLRKVVVQAVADTYDLLEAGPWPEENVDDPRLARFVAIGRGLKGRRGEELVREFEEVVMGKV